VSDGWMTVNTGDCQTDTQHAGLTSFYYCAETDVFDKHTTSWGRDKEFSVKDGNFVLRSADKPQKGARAVKFTGPHSFSSSDMVTLEFEPDLSIVFVLPKGNAARSAAIDAAEDACDNKSGDAAIAGCTQLIANDPNNEAAYNNRGLEYASKHDYDRAIADYSKAIEIKPNYPRAFNNRGWSFYRKNDVSHAIADFTKAIDLDPSYEHPLENRGEVYRVIGDYNKALNDLNAAIKLSAKSNFALHSRARVFEALGRKADAIADYRQARWSRIRLTTTARMRSSAWAQAHDRAQAGEPRSTTGFRKMIASSSWSKWQRGEKPCSQLSG
jgi:Tfp pilus assembly protein PilF